MYLKMKRTELSEKNRFYQSAKTKKMNQKSTEILRYFHLKRIVKIIERENFSEAIYIRWHTQFRGKHKMTQDIAEKFIAYTKTIVSDIDMLLNLKKNSINDFQEHSLFTEQILSFCERWEINKTELFSLNNIASCSKMIDMLRGKSAMNEEKYNAAIRSIVELKIRLISNKKLIVGQYTNIDNAHESKKYNSEYWKEYYENKKGEINKRQKKYYQNRKSKARVAQAKNNEITSTELD